jgi:hypothetical protein
VAAESPPPSADVDQAAPADEADGAGASADISLGAAQTPVSPAELSVAPQTTSDELPPPVGSSGTAMAADIRSAFAFLDKEGREGSVDPSWETGNNTGLSGNEACSIEVNLVRNRLSIFERLSQQAAAAPAIRPSFTKRAARAKSEAAGEQVDSLGPAGGGKPMAPSTVYNDQPGGTPATSFSERVRKISEQDAVIFESMNRNAAEDHEELGLPRGDGGSVYPHKTQMQENVISEYTRKHSSDHSPGQPAAATVKTPQATAAKNLTGHYPVRTGFAHQARIATPHAQQSPTMENIQRSLGLSEAVPVERPAVGRGRPLQAAAARDTPSKARQQSPTYNLQKSGFSVTLKSQQQRSPSVPPTDPAARKQVYSQYRELLKKFSHHREETV